MQQDPSKQRMRVRPFSSFHFFLGHEVEWRNESALKTNYPKISVITPSLNQGKFIEATINSVLSQEYPNLEYIIMDGGSVDGTLKILENYSNYLTWRSEKDSGQTNAINKGFRLAQGEIIAYLNTDDVLLPDTFNKVATVFTNQPDIMWVTGQCYITDEDDNETRKLITLYKNLMLRLHNFPLLLMTNYISQPATFWRRNVLDSLGLLDESLNYVMDYEFWLRLYSNYRLHFIPSYLASFRIHPHSKTSAQGHKEEYISEERTIVRKYTDSKMLVFLHNFHRSIMTSAYKLMNHSN